MGKSKSLVHSEDKGRDLVFFSRKIGGVAGGLERMLVALMNELSRRGHRVRLVTWDSAGALAHYGLDQEIEWFKLNLGDPGVKASFVERVIRFRRIRSYLKAVSPDLIVAFQSGAAIVSNICSFGLGINVIASERVSPDMWKYTRKGIINRIIDIYMLGMADKITVQFADYIKYYPRMLHNRMVVIPNPVYKANFSRLQMGAEGGVILYVARLCFQKNHQLLLCAFSLIANLFPGWNLALAGDGESREEVMELIDTLNIRDRVVLHGAVADVESLYAGSDIVAFPSLFEGFPNALSEALAWGLPCVGVRDTLGVNQLIQDGVNGFLVDARPKAFAEGLRKLIEDRKLRVAMGGSAALISERYAPKTSFDLWESLILEESRQ